MADLYQDQRSLPLPHCNRADGRQKLIDSLGTSPTDVVAEGITVYVDYVEQQISECCNGSEASLVAVLGPNSGDDSNIRVVQLLELVSRVCILLRDLERQTSLDTLAKQLVTQHKPRILPAASTHDDGAVRDEHHILFACIGWLSMTYIPLTTLSGPVLRIVDTSANVSQSKSGANALIPLPQPSGLIQRPLGSMLRRMGLLPLPCPAKPTSQGMEINPYQRYAKEPEMTLTVSVLCYYSLRSIGRITVIWTGSLLEHCKLDPTRRELKLFRFPAYCVQQLYTHESHQNILLQILKPHSCRGGTCENDLPREVNAYFYEILLSYRLLFGLDKGSRKRFKREQLQHSRNGSLRDPVLSILCGKKNASQILDIVGSIRHREVFDAHQDFPHLGERLMKLQSYNSKQQPSAWRTILFDRRDPQQRLTFFGTVVIIGGISILLSAIQTSLAIAQLAISQKKC